MSSRRDHSRQNEQRDKDGNLREQLRSMQQMERETQETLAKFMTALSTRNETDYASILEDKVAELQQAEAENIRLRNEMDKYEDRIESLQKHEDQLIREKNQIQDEKLRAGKAATQADTIIKNMQSQLRQLEQKHSQDLELKNSMLRNLEEENVRSKVHSDEAKARLEAYTHETAELHGAMASLHGEIAAQQRELDEAKERDARNARQKKELNVRMDENDAELNRLKSERRNLEAKCTDLEKKLHDAAMRDDQIQQEGKTRVEEFVRERESVQGSLAKMSHKLRQQTETSKELNAALSRLRLELSSAQESSARESARAEAAIRDVQSLQIVTQSLERSKTEADALVQRLEQDKLGMTADLSQANERVASLLAEQRKLTAQSDKLERQRTELTVELSCRTKELEGLKRNHDGTNVDLEEARARQDTERLGKERALERIGALEGELDRAKSDIREHLENIESQARQLRESERMREQALETSRAQQRESANRIIEFSQKNAKLSSEISAKEEEIATLRRNRQDEYSRGVESSKERDDAKSQYLATKVRLQALEDEHELSVAKYEASKAENGELRAQIKQEIKSREAAIKDLLEKHDETVEKLTLRLEAEAEDKVNIADSTRKAVEEKLSRAIAKEKENHKEAIAALETARQEDAEVQRARLATLAKAMEGLQGELREESAKNSNLTQELSVLKDLAEVGNSEMQERINYVEREKGRERSRLEGQLTDLKEQLRQLTEQKQQRDQLMITVEQQLTREREAKFAAMQRVRSAEDENNSLTNQVDSLAEENTSHKKELRNFERKLALAIQSKDAEIVRLTRRNEVLGEAVTRLTSNSQGPSSRESSGSKSLSKVFTSGITVSPADEAIERYTADVKSPVVEVKGFSGLFSPDKEATEEINPAAAATGHGSTARPTEESSPSERSLPNNERSEGFLETAASAPVTSVPALPNVIAQESEGDFSMDELVKQAVSLGAQQAMSPVATPGKPNLGLSKEDGGSGGFKEKLQTQVEIGKGIQLPFSPKKARASTAPVSSSPETDEKILEKENDCAQATSSKTEKTKSSDRIKRAAEFMKQRKGLVRSSTVKSVPVESAL